MLYEDKILDGRNRWNACKAAGVAPQFREFNSAADGDPLEFVVVTNLHRRHLTPSQCAMVGADLATMRQGDRTDLGQPSASLPEVSQAQAARLSTASERSVRSAVFVKKKGSRDLVQAVRAGKIAVSLAAKLATTPEAIQRQAVAEPERAHVLVKQAARAERESELAAKQLALPTKRFGVIYADPPWQFEVYSRDTGLDRDPSNHYPVDESSGHQGARRRIHRRARFRAVPVGDRADAARGARGHGGLGIRVPNELRLGEGPRRHGLLGSQSARASPRRRQAATSRRPPPARSGRA